MNVLTEADLRCGKIKPCDNTVHVKKGTFVTPLAYEYLKSNSLSLCFDDNAQSGGSFGKGVMSYSPIKNSGSRRFVDFETGEGYSDKPEHMTHLRENLLVAKNHPRILLRGKFDSLEALIMQTQVTAQKSGYEQIALDLDDVMSFVQILLGCEVNETPVPEIKLLGMNSQRLRYVSHHLREEFGIDHSVPHYSMGETCVALNSLRTAIRETELVAVEAFLQDGKVIRSDIVEALNRLSSCVYIIFCKKISGHYEKG